MSLPRVVEIHVQVSFHSVVCVIGKHAPVNVRKGMKIMISSRQCKGHVISIAKKGGIAIHCAGMQELRFSS